jgi:hypothetical protein
VGASIGATNSFAIPSVRSATISLCEKCQELEKKIERFRLIMERVPDAQLAERITRLIKEAEAEKAALHPAQQRK